MKFQSKASDYSTMGRTYKEESLSSGKKQIGGQDLDLRLDYVTPPRKYNNDARMELTELSANDNPLPVTTLLNLFRKSLQFCKKGS